MKNKYLTLSMLLIGVGGYALPQHVTAQLLSRAQTKYEGNGYQQQPATTDPLAVSGMRSHSSRSLKKALADLEKRFNVNFAYDEQLITGRQAEVNIGGLTLEQALTQIIESQGLRYQRITGNLFVIQASSKNAGAGPTPPADLLNKPLAQVSEVPQARKITGQITDENNAGLPGANVIEKGTSSGTTTDASGNFVLNVSDAATTLTISSVGYISQDVAIGNRTTISVKLAPDNRTLDEVVVVSYGTVKKSNLTEAVSIVNTVEAKKVQAEDLGSASKDLFDSIKKGDFPKWDMFVQIMSDDEHPELDWDPLDDTKIWPEDQFPLRKVGTMTLNRNVENFFAENEQIAMGTGVLVDGLDFSDDKMLVGRTFSYSDTQRHRVGTNYLQLKVNSPQGIKHPVATNQRDGQMTIMVDTGGENPHVNYEPSIHGGLKESSASAPIHQPEIHGKLTRSVIDRRNDYAQARARFVTMNDWERDDLVLNMGNLLGQCERDVQERMLWHFFLVHDDYGSNVGKAIGLTAKHVHHLAPLAKQVLTEEDTRRLENLGANGDHLDKSKYGKHTGSVETHMAKAEDLLMRAKQPDPRYADQNS